jgi:hypothetical protein
MSAIRNDQPAPASRQRSAPHRVARAALLTALGVGAVSLAAAPAYAAAPAQTTPGNAPFASGKLVSRSGSTLDIQGFAGDSKVIVTSSTKYQQTGTADPSAVTKGSCVRVTGTGSTSKGIAATSVSVTPAASKCATVGGLFGGGGGFGGRRNRTGNGPGNGTGNGGTFPGGSRPTFTAPAGGNANGTGNGFPTDVAAISGKVTKVSGTTVKVKGQVLQLQRNRNPNSNSNTQPKPKTATVTVTLASTTRVSNTVAATDSVLTIGACVSAAGTTDSVGTVTARTVTVSPANSDGMCVGAGGFRGRFGGAGGGGGGGGAGGTGGGGNGVFNGGGQGGSGANGTT